MKYNALIDGDVLVYRCGYAGQYNQYILNGADVFRYKKELDKYIKTNGIKDYTVDINTVIEPVGFVLNNLKTTLNAIKDRTAFIKCEIFLSGKDNFRNDVAITQVYKGNRDKDQRPAWYNELREYLITYWGAEVVNGCEADDVLASKQIGMVPENCEANLIITIDKDLDQIPGWHYNWVHDNLYFLDDYTASRNFWIQMLTGDRTDNIRGIHGVGPKKAEKFLDKFDPCEWENEVFKLYEMEYSEGKGQEIFDEHKKLIKIGVP